MIARALILFLIAFSSRESFAQNNAYNWKNDWSLRRSFSIEIDSEGYHFPTSMAFVPKPGSGPKDVLYFVTELRGTLKVVTNDRTVYKFAEAIFRSTPARELPYEMGEVGMAGVCLDPQNGFVFATYAYQDSNNIIFNNIVRFSTTPGTFSISPHSRLDFTDIFRKHESGTSHQIGNCQVADGTLYVGVGDAHKPFDTQKLDNPRGKILRLTLDGKPVEDNPFRVNNEITKVENYIYAYGLRNPFAMEFLSGRLFVAENGKDTDRFNEIQKGKNYQWDGTDWSIGLRAIAVFKPTLAPVQMDYLSPSNGLFPVEYDGHFFVSSYHGDIIDFGYGIQEKELAAIPKHFIRNVGLISGDKKKSLTGLAFGPDGLYFTPLYPNVEGKTRVLKIKHTPGKNHPILIEKETDPRKLMEIKGCFSCHSMTDTAGQVGPSLEKNALRERLKSRLLSKEYIRSIKKLDEVKLVPYTEFRGARGRVLKAEGMDRVRVWMKYHLVEPSFDNPSAQMPNLALTAEEAVLISNLLLGPAEEDPVETRPRARKRGGKKVPQVETNTSQAETIAPKTDKKFIYSFVFGVVLTICVSRLWKVLKR